MLFVDEFRSIIYPLIKNNIGELPLQADEVRNFNKILTKFAPDILLSKMIGNNTTMKEHNLLLLNNKDNGLNSIFGEKFNNDIKELGIIKYKNKQCSFKITNNYNAFYYTVILS